MGERPCPILPVPKVIDLADRPRRWPGRLTVRCACDEAAALVERFAAIGSVRDEGPPLSLVLERAALRPEEYEIVFADSEVVVRAAQEAGFRHAWQTLRQLATGPTVPRGPLRDWPDLPLRGFHLNFENCRRLDAPTAVGLLRTAAALKLNVVLVEYGSRLSFRSHPGIAAGDALSDEDVARLDAAAAEVGIELIPLQQSLAHLDFALEKDYLVHLRERPERANLMCPSAPGSLALFRELAEETMERHPKAGMFHIGGDEARKVGACPRCRSTAQRQGIGALYGGYIGAAARWVLERGRRPVVWDDTLCAHPDAMAHLPKETVIAYWDYLAVADPTPVLIPRMAHAAGGPRVAHDWRWMLPRRRRQLSQVQAQVMASYSAPTRLKSALGRGFLREFGRYLGPRFPTWIRALPYLEYYRDRGFDVITSPTGMGNGDTADGVPNWRRFEENIRTHARRCKQSGQALGIITTAWYNMPVETLYQPMIWTAQHAW